MLYSIVGVGLGASISLYDKLADGHMPFLLQDVNLGEYPGVDDSWMDIVTSQGSSLLSVDLSGSDISDSGLSYLKNCKSIQAVNLNYCDLISDRGLEQMSGTNPPSVEDIWF